MGVYSKRIFPRILDWSMRDKNIEKIRKEILVSASGRVLEIGFGTGLNLKFYPESGIEEVVGLEPNPGMMPKAAERIAKTDHKVEVLEGAAEKIPADDSSFDTVVCTFTLCSVADAGRVLSEMFRVMKGGGRLLLAEHGLSPDEKVSRWQNRINPAWRVFGDGCNLNRDIEGLVRAAGFELNNRHSFYMEKTPRVMGYVTMGWAQIPETKTATTGR